MVAAALKSFHPNLTTHQKFLGQIFRLIVMVAALAFRQRYCIPGSLWELVPTVCHLLIHHHHLSCVFWSMLVKSFGRCRCAARFVSIYEVFVVLMRV